MAELLKCKICGFETVQAGMSNHIRHKHATTYSELIGDISSITESLGKIKYEDFRVKKKAGQVKKDG